MTALLKRESLLPTWTNDLFDTGRFLSPQLFNFDSDRFDFANRVPSVNITENEKEFKIEMAAPGLERKDFKVEVEDGMLCISSEKKEESKEEKKNYTRGSILIIALAVPLLYLIILRLTKSMRSMKMVFCTSVFLKKK